MVASRCSTASRLAPNFKLVAYIALAKYAQGLWFMSQSEVCGSSQSMQPFAAMLGKASRLQWWVRGLKAIYLFLEHPGRALGANQLTMPHGPLNGEAFYDNPRTGQSYCATDVAPHGVPFRER